MELMGRVLLIPHEMFIESMVMQEMMHQISHVVTVGEKKAIGAKKKDCVWRTHYFGSKIHVHGCFDNPLLGTSATEWFM